MDSKTFRWFIRWVDGTFLFWFTVYLFWIHKPGWRWFFLVLVILDAFGTSSMNQKMGLEEYVQKS